jgi:sugar O-acyltransferase (sialic acid O-acetyltransferase NeuD family)
MNKVVIFGLGQMAEVAHFYLERDSELDVVAFTVHKEFKDRDEFHELPVVPFEDIRTSYPPSEFSLFAPVSYKKVNKNRAEIFAAGKEMGYSFVTYISSRATYYDTPVGENCFIFENNVIQPYTSIADDVIMWSGNHFGHHSRIGNHCFIASHVVISGGVEVGDYTFIGVNATIRDNISIGKENVIGAGAIILDSTEDRAVYPAKKTEKATIPSNRLKRI